MQPNSHKHQKSRAKGAFFLLFVRKVTKYFLNLHQIPVLINIKMIQD